MDNNTQPLDGAVVLILVGLVASGKSTFAQGLEHHFPQFRRCNQDDLGNRRKVENLVRQTLRKGMSVCVDRTNFNPQLNTPTPLPDLAFAILTDPRLVTTHHSRQRSYWINIAREFPGTSVWVIVFDTPYETCANRLRERTCHPTIKSAEEGLSILARFASDLQLPTPVEGYDRILSLNVADQPLSPAYTREQIAALLQRVRNSPPVTTPFQHKPISSGCIPRANKTTTGGSSSSSSSHIRGGGFPRGGRAFVNGYPHRGRIMRTFTDYASPGTSRGRAAYFARGPFSGSFVTEGQPSAGIGDMADSYRPDRSNGIVKDVAGEQSPGGTTAIFTATREGGNEFSDGPTTITR